MDREIDLRQLQALTNQVFDFAISTFEKEKITLDKALYWDIDKQARYDPTQTPTESHMGLGDLVEDLKDIESLANGDKSDTCTLHFLFLAKIFQYLGESDEWFE